MSSPFDLFGGFFAMAGGFMILVVLASFGIFATVIVLLVRSVATAAATNAQNDASPILASPATVAAKRTQVSGHENSFTWYYATFEFQNGERTEFSVKGQEFGMLADGDRGMLRYQGTRYLGFSRQVH